MLFIFDANYPPDFVKGLSIIDKADKHSKIPVEVIFSGDFMGSVDCDDEEIIIKASNRNAVIITQDRDFKKIKHYRALMQEHQVGYIFFRIPNGKHLFWDIVKSFINSWAEIKENVSKSEHPFAFEINKKGELSPLTF